MFLYKRAQIFAGDLWGAFGGTGLGAFHDVDRLTMCDTIGSGPKPESGHVRVRANIYVTAHEKASVQVAAMMYTVALICLHCLIGACGV